MLKLFLFSLRDKAIEWFHSLPRASITTWSQMEDLFLWEFFPLAQVREIQDAIDHFQQRDREPLYEAWKRFGALLRKCPSHEVPPTDKFFLGLNPQTMKEENTAVGGAFMTKSR